MNKTSIEWTDFTWNPIRARRYKLSGGPKTGTFCTRISPGCQHCYASVINTRFGTGLEYSVPNLAEHEEFFIDEKILAQPMHRKKPARIFVGDMFDLFHEAIPFELIRQVSEIISECQQHTFQLLTKRAKRMREFSQWMAGPDHISIAEWPRNVWLGVSVEDQKRHDERAPLLQQTPAAVRFLSVEPQLEEIRLVIDTPEVGEISTLRGFDGCDPPIPGIDWVIVGGESGPGARPFNLAWAESILDQCRAAEVPCFIKQLGSRPEWPNKYWQGLRPPRLHDRKGGDPAEWPERLRVREFPS